MSSQEESNEVRKRISERQNLAADFEARGVSNALEGLVSLENFKAEFSDVYDVPVLKRAAELMDGALADSESFLYRPIAERQSVIGAALRHYTDPEVKDTLAYVSAEQIADAALKHLGHNNGAIVETVIEARLRQRGVK